MQSAVIERYECQPNDTSCVHGETNELRLVEVLGYLASLDGIHGARDDEQHVVGQRQQERVIAQPTFDNNRVWSVERCRKKDIRWFENEPDDVDDHLYGYE